MLGALPYALDCFAVVRCSLLDHHSALLTGDEAFRELLLGPPNR